MGFAVIAVLLMAGSSRWSRSSRAQRECGVWFVFPGIVAFFIYLVAGIAETNRNPFDLPEAESELVAGFHTEYSGDAAGRSTSWPSTPTWWWSRRSPPRCSSAAGCGPSPTWPRSPSSTWSRPLSGSRLKLAGFLFVYIWFRGTFPRYRFDQLMALGWKWLLPVSLWSTS